MADAVNFHLDEPTHTYTVNGVRVPSVTQILEELGIIDYRGVPPEMLKHAKDRGVAAHLACQYYDEDDLDGESLDPQITPYVAGWHKFRQEHHFRIIEIEQIHLGEVYGRRYGMKIDRLVDWAGQPTIIEIKCSSKIHRWYGAQTAAYAIGLGTKPGTKPEQSLAGFRRTVVHLKPNATYSLHEYDDPRDGVTFEYALYIAYWKNGFK